jgi:hypothetical protein
VVVPLLRVEKLTVPTPVIGVTATVKFTEFPAYTFVAEGEIVTELAVREAAHAIAKAFASTEPRPVTKLYPVVVSALEASKPKTSVLPVLPGQITSAGCPDGVAPWQ